MKPIVSLNLANALAKLVAADALPALLGVLVPANLVSRDFEPVIGQVGEPPITTHVEATFQVPDVTKIIAVPDLLRLYMEPAIAALQEKLDSAILNFISLVPAGNRNFWFPTEQLYRVVSPQTWLALRQEPQFSIYESAGSAGVRAMVDGPVGKDADVFVFRSTHAENKRSLQFSKSALCLTTRRLTRPAPSEGILDEYSEIDNFGMRVQMHYNPATLAQQFTLDLLYGVHRTGRGHLSYIQE